MRHRAGYTDSTSDSNAPRSICWERRRNSSFMRNSWPVIPIDNVSDPRIDVYTRLKDRDIAQLGGRFIAEGELVVRRLLASSYRCESVLLADHKVAEIAPLAPE